MTGVIGNVFFFEWEIRLMEWLQAHISQSGAGFWLLSNLSAFGEQLLLVVVMGFLYWGLDKEFGKFVGVNVIVANVWNPMIKNIFLRLRPYFVSDKIDLLRLVDSGADKYDVAAQGYSFPSGHSTSAVTLYGSLAVHEKKKRVFWALAIILPILVGFSRVLVGAHYPTDVLVGWLLGAAVVAVVPLLHRRIKNRWAFYGVLLLTTLPGFFYCTSSDYYTGLGMLLGFLLAEPFEEKFVRFENTRNLLRCVLRVIGGGAVYFGLNVLLKLPFTSELLDSGTFAAYLIRTLRYTVVIFVAIGVYPMLFKVTGKLWEKKG